MNIFCSRRGFTTTQLSGLIVARHSSWIALQFEWSPVRAIHRLVSHRLVRISLRFYGSMKNRG
jgi:hypothetical protein